MLTSARYISPAKDIVSIWVSMWMMNERENPLAVHNRVVHHLIRYHGHHIRMWTVVSSNQCDYANKFELSKLWSDEFSRNVEGTD